MKEAPPSEGVEIPKSPCATARSEAAASAAALAVIAASPPRGPARRGAMDAGVLVGSGQSMSCGGLFFFFNDTATTEIYTLSLHDALPISETDAPLEF